MTQEEVKEYLLQLEPGIKNFKVVFSGKSSKTFHGLYYPDTCEILIHNKNFTDDNALMYTAIHEFAHHVQSVEKGEDVQYERRPHTIAFRNTLHQLVSKAESLGFYKNLFDVNQDFQELTRKIKDQYLAKNGSLMKDFGRLLIEALDLCQQYQASFEDYVERVLSLHQSQARMVMKMYALDIDPKLGYDNMRIVASVNDDEQRRTVQEMLVSGQSQDVAKTFIKEHKPKSEDTLQKLEAEKKRLQKTLDLVTKKLEAVESKLHNVRGD
jgi:hypothetical protein